MKVRHYLGLCATLSALYSSTAISSTCHILSDEHGKKIAWNPSEQQEAKTSNALLSTAVTTSKMGWHQTIRDFLEEYSVSTPTDADYLFAADKAASFKDEKEYMTFLSKLGLVDRLYELLTRNDDSRTIVDLLKIEDDAELHHILMQQIRLSRYILMQTIHKEESEVFAEKYRGRIKERSVAYEALPISCKTVYHQMSKNGLPEALLRIGKKLSHDYETTQQESCLLEDDYLDNPEAIQETLNNLGLAYFAHLTSEENGNIRPLASLMREEHVTLLIYTNIELATRTNIVLQLLSNKAQTRFDEMKAQWKVKAAPVEVLAPADPQLVDKSDDKDIGNMNNFKIDDDPLDQILTVTPATVITPADKLMDVMEALEVVNDPAAAPETVVAPETKASESSDEEEAASEKKSGDGDVAPHESTAEIDKKPTIGSQIKAKLKSKFNKSKKAKTADDAKE